MANRNYRGGGRQFSHNPWQQRNTSAQPEFGYAAELAANRNLLLATDLISNIFNGQGSNNSSQFGNARQNSYGFQFGQSQPRYGMGYSNTQNDQQFRARRSGPIRSSELLARPGNTRSIKNFSSKNDNKNIVASKMETVEIGDPAEYDTLSKEALNCHICERRFDNGKTFVEHLRSRKHKVAMTYAEMEYSTLRNVAVPPGPGEQKRIKKYLQASCSRCKVSFNSRIQLDEHLLSLQHLKRLPKKSIAPKYPEFMVFTLEQESVFLRPPKAGKKAQKIMKKEGNGTATGEDSAAAPEEAVPPILDIEEGQDFSQVKEASIPGYNAETGVGKSFVVDFTLKRCRLCSKLLDSDETVQVHLRTPKHYQAYVAKLRVMAGLPAMIQDDCADVHGFSQPTISVIRKRVAEAIASHSRRHIKMPTTQREQDAMIAEFAAIRGFPQVLGAIDCTHIRIRKVGGEIGQYYINRKNFYSLNIQGGKRQNKKENSNDVNESDLKKLKIGDDEKMDTNDVPDNVAQILDGDDMWNKIDQMIKDETAPTKESAN